VENLADFGSLSRWVGGLGLLVVIVLVLARFRRSGASAASAPAPEPPASADDAAYLDSSHIINGPLTGSGARHRSPVDGDASANGGNAASGRFPTRNKPNQDGPK